MAIWFFTAQIFISSSQPPYPIKIVLIQSILLVKTMLKMEIKIRERVKNMRSHEFRAKGLSKCNKDETYFKSRPHSMN